MTPDAYFELAEAHLLTGGLATLLGEHVPICTDPTEPENITDYFDGPSGKEHGTRYRCMAGCRCKKCVEAKREYDRRWRARRG